MTEEVQSCAKTDRDALLNKAQDKTVMRGILVCWYRSTEPLFNSTVQHYFEACESYL